jgi:hypothetical protein
MEWQSEWEDIITTYLSSFDPLMGDKRTRTTFTQTVRGIIMAGSLVCQRIAAQSQILSSAKDGAQRVIRLASGESTKRSHVDAEHLTEQLRVRGLAQLAEADTDEVWLMLDASELRKPHAHTMPALMQVRDLNGGLVPGYRTVNVLGVTPQRRGLLYHRLFSSQEPDFVSEPIEMQRALRTVSQAMAPLKPRMTATWVLDSGLDDVAIWRTIWEQGEHVVCRVQHTERKVEYLAGEGTWRTGDIETARQQFRLVTTAQTDMVVRRGRQMRPKLQTVTAEISACPIRLTYATNVRREGPGETVHRRLRLVEVRLQGTKLEPWLLVTDWAVTDADSGMHIFRMYRQRWAVEDSFKFTKECLGWEEVQVLDLTGIRTLVALAWVAAGFLYELGVTLEWPEVQLLARLGGWSQRTDRKPGKIILTRGLRRLLEVSATEAFLKAYVAEHGALPPRFAAILGESVLSKL